MEKLIPNQYYHILNRANGNDVFFKEEENYYFFLSKYKKHIHTIVKTLAYALLGNHFHLVVQVRSVEELKAALPKFKTLEGLNEQSNYISKQFANFFSSYTQSFNKLYNRNGSLFQKNFKRNLLQSDEHLKNAIIYVHRNPVHHGFCNRIDDWSFMSYHSLLSQQATLLDREQVFKLFNSKENFESRHIEATEKWLVEHEEIFENN